MNRKITTQIDDILKYIDSFNNDTTPQSVSIITYYDENNYRWISETNWNAATSKYVHTPTDSLVKGDVEIKTLDSVYVFVFKGVKYFGVETKAYTGYPNIAVLFNKHIPETKGIKWTKSIDNLRTYIEFIVNQKRSHAVYGKLPTTPEEACFRHTADHKVLYYIGRLQEEDLDVVRSLVDEYYTEKWKDVKKDYINYMIRKKEAALSQRETLTKEYEKQLESSQNIYNSIREELEKLRDELTQF